MATIIDTFTHQEEFNEMVTTWIDELKELQYTELREEIKEKKIDLPKFSDYKFPVSEIFPAIQGEGSLVGTRTIFVRLGGCDYRCAWCDSLYSVLPEHRNEWERMDAAQIIAGVYRHIPTLVYEEKGFGHVTLSGGNPAIHPLDHLINLMHEYNLEVAIETQGTVNPKYSKIFDHVTLSPKPPSAKNKTRIKTGQGETPEFIQFMSWLLGALDSDLKPPVCVKIVIFDEKDLEFAEGIYNSIRLFINMYHPRLTFYLQVGTPQDIVNIGTSYIRDRLIKRTLDLEQKFHASIARYMPRARLSVQQHVLLHGLGRGF